VRQPDRVGLPQISRHDLGHTCATIRLMVGKDRKYVRSPLGHANVSITLATSSHAFERMDGGSGVAVEEVL